MHFTPRSPLCGLQVAQLEMQLAAAERCSAELREITTALGSVRQEDVEVLRVSRQGGQQVGTRWCVNMSVQARVT